MPQINNQQSYALANPKGGRIQPLGHYINQPTPRSIQPKDMAHAYSLHLERSTLQHKRHTVDVAMRKPPEGKPPWRANLDVLRNKPRPHDDSDLLIAGGQTGSKNHHRKKLAPLTKIEGYLTDKKEDSNGKSHRVKHTGTKKLVKQNKTDQSKVVETGNGESLRKSETLEFGIIMNPVLSSEERYEQYVRDLEPNGDWLQQSSRTEQEFKDMLAREGGGGLTTDDEENVDEKDDGNMGSRPHYNDAGSRAASKAPSRVGRVSSLGLDGRMSVTGTQFNDKKETLSRLSMNSSFCNGDKEGKGYTYRDGEIQRKVLLSTSRENGMSPTVVEKNVKLMDYLTKNTKVIPVYDDGARETTKKSRSLHNSTGKKTSLDADMRGGGWKMATDGGKSKRQPNFDKLIPVSVVNKSCEIQTQTEP